MELFENAERRWNITRKELLAVLVVSGSLLFALIVETVLLFAYPTTDDVPYSQQIRTLIDNEMNAAKQRSAIHSLKPASTNPPQKTVSSSTVTPAQRNTPALVTDSVQIVNINTSTKEQLVAIKGIGEKTADKIIAYRQKTPFKRIEDLMRIKGIGEKKFAKWKHFLSVGETK